MGPDGGTPIGRALVLWLRDDETAMARPGDHDPLGSLEERTVRGLVPVIHSPTRMISISDAGAEDHHQREAAILARRLELIGSGRPYWQKRRPCALRLFKDWKCRGR